MSLMAQATILLQLALAGLLSMLIGLDRERSKKPAGLRTHMLTGVGACMFTVVGLYAFPQADTSRVASSVVEGVGFIGAGTIFLRDDRVRALTTAASIWATASIGVVVAVGAWLLAIGGTIFIWGILVILHKWEVEQFEHAQAHTEEVDLT